MNMNMNSENKDNEILNDHIKYECNIESLIKLKFLVEKQFNTLYDAVKEAKKIKLYNISDDLDIYAIYTMYNNNIEMSGDEFLRKQTELLKSIDALLMKKCLHNWVDDVIDTAFSSYNICYCSNCFVRKNLK